MVTKAASLKRLKSCLKPWPAVKDKDCFLAEYRAILRLNTVKTCKSPKISKDTFYRHKSVAKLGDMSHSTYYAAFLPGWLNVRVTSDQHVPRVKEARNVSVVSLKHLQCFSLQIASRASKFLRWLNWETSRGHVTNVNAVRDVPPTCHVLRVKLRIIK